MPGHRAINCNSRPHCPKCGRKGHNKWTCTVDITIVTNRKCANCNGQHCAAWGGCKAVKDERQILSIRQKENVPRHEAKTIWQQREEERQRNLRSQAIEAELQAALQIPGSPAYRDAFPEIVETGSTLNHTELSASNLTNVQILESEEAPQNISQTTSPSQASGTQRIVSNPTESTKSFSTAETQTTQEIPQSVNNIELISILFELMSELISFSVLAPEMKEAFTKKLSDTISQFSVTQNPHSLPQPMLEATEVTNTTENQSLIMW